MSRRRNIFWVISANSESVFENKIGIFLRALWIITQNDIVFLPLFKSYNPKVVTSHTLSDITFLRFRK